MENIDKDILIAVYENRLNKTTKELIYQQTQSATTLKMVDDLKGRIKELEGDLTHKDNTIEDLIESKSKQEIDYNTIVSNFEALKEEYDNLKKGYTIEARDIYSKSVEEPLEEAHINE